MQLFPHFVTDLDEIFTECYQSCDLAHIVRISGFIHSFVMEKRGFMVNIIFHQYLFYSGHVVAYTVLHFDICKLSYGTLDKLSTFSFGKGSVCLDTIFSCLPQVQRAVIQISLFNPLPGNKILDRSIFR